MNYCPDCGEAVQEKQQYCMECGARLPLPPGVEPQSRATQQARPQQPDSDSGSSTRRGVLVAGTLFGGTLLGSVGLVTLLESKPHKPAKKFMQALGNGNFSEANNYIHSDAKIDGAGAAADLVAGAVGVDALFDVAKISVVNAKTKKEGDSNARVKVTIDVDAIVNVGQGTVGFVMKTDGNSLFGNDWRVWNIG